jgi:hypothetical protein
MTETRKAIIEIIEPYMEKDLSEGCIIETAWCRDWCCSMETEIYWIDTNKIEIEKYWRYIIEIIWHYDITAVLKYISSLWYTHQWWWLWFWLHKNWNIETWPIMKPLNLYSNTEEKELLNLLLKLK